jgi:pyruvate/oxaloacetate carboxyltransferase
LSQSLLAALRPPAREETVTVLEEVARVRAELGHPIVVTLFPQMV